MRENKIGKIHTGIDRRRVLGDVTNQSGNRGFSLVTRNPDSKPLSGVKRSVENIDVDSHLCRKIVRNEVSLSPLKGGKTYRLQSGLGHMGCPGVVEVKEHSCSGLDNIDLGEDRDLVCAINVGDAANKGGQGEETRRISNVGGDSDCSLEELGARVLSDTGKSVGGDCLTSSRSDSFETLTFTTESKETRSFGLERCLNKDGGKDLLKNCSCSFCTKAAYIWSDLQCLDVKGRISTLAKSRREASNLAQRYSKESPMQRNSSMAPHLQTDLTTLWSSHFLHMDTIFAAETNQLESNFAILKDLREQYKMNLKMI
ncbi:hypothetical protein KSS87_018919 [Heliosperma pusillum]|nr:hypothetical protein KSS87_018919 [Heliosperma pusillum]